MASIFSSVAVWERDPMMFSYFATIESARDFSLGLDLNFQKKVEESARKCKKVKESALDWIIRAKLVAGPLCNV